MSQAGFTPISLYFSTTAAATPSAGNLAAGELAVNITDGKLFYKDNGGVVRVLATTAGSAGDVVGPGSSTDNALVRFDTTTGKLVQNSVGVLSDAGVLTGLTGLTSSGNVTLSALTSGRVTYATTAGLLTDSANLTFDGTTLTSAAIESTTTGFRFPDASTQSTAATGFGFKNRLINGAMVIDQRNAGASVTVTADVYTVDRWIAQQTAASKYSVQRNAGAVTSPVGFANYLGATSLSAYSVAAGDYFMLRQGVEGYNFADMAWGTANAKTVTLSALVYSSLTGTFSGALQNNAETRSYPFAYSIPVANTWTPISITVAGDTSGAWLTTNGQALRVIFSLGTGTTYSGTAGAWAAANYKAATGAVSVVGTNGATFYITGVQLEKGSTATAFDYRPYGTELALCQRYFATSSLYYEGYNTAGGPLAATGNNFPVTMRAAPTVTYAFSNIQNAAQGADRGIDTGRIARYCLAVATGTATALEAYKASAEL